MGRKDHRVPKFLDAMHALTFPGHVYSSSLKCLKSSNKIISSSGGWSETAQHGWCGTTNVGWIENSQDSWGEVAGSNWGEGDGSKKG